MSVAAVGSGGAGPVTHGADTGALRGLAAQTSRDADEIARTTDRLGTAVAGLAWCGPDQQRFAQDWGTRFAPSLVAVAAALTTASEHLGRQADEQDAASGAAVGHAGSISAPADPAADAARERGEASWARGAGRLLLGALGAAVGGPLGGLIGSLAGPEVIDHLVGVADERADRTTVTDITAEAGVRGTLPRGPGDLVAAMSATYDVEGAVRVDEITRADGSRLAVVHVPGTQDWSGDPDGVNPMGAFGAVASASGKDSALRVTVLEAMRGVQPGTPVVLVTHSQGAFTALDLAADPYVRSRHTIDSVVTTGAGGGNFALPDHVRVVSVRNPLDPVARIGGPPAGAIEVTGTWWDTHPHSSRGYAELVQRTRSPELDAWWGSLGLDGARGVQTRVYRGAVAPGP